MNQTTLIDTCTSCSYSLEGLPSGAPCPECGQTQQKADDFVVCSQCGYYLAGLKLDSNCPECGKAIGESLVMHSIYRGGRAYVDRLASGARLILLAAYLAVGSVFVIFAAMLASGTLGVVAGGVGPMAGMVLGILLYVAMLLASAIVWLIGWIRATTPDPLLGHAAPTDRKRGATRGLAIAIFCLQFGSLIPFLGWLASLANMICIIIFFFIASSYIRLLGERMPSAKLVRTVGRVRTAGVVLGAIFVVSIIIVFVGMISALAAQGQSPIAATVMLAAGIAFPISALALLLVYLRLVGTFAKQMKACRERARSLPTNPMPRELGTPILPTRSVE